MNELKFGVQELSISEMGKTNGGLILTMLCLLAAAAIIGTSHAVYVATK